MFYTFIKTKGFLFFKKNKKTKTSNAFEKAKGIKFEISNNTLTVFFIIKLWTKSNVKLNGPSNNHHYKVKFNKGFI